MAAAGGYAHFRGWRIWYRRLGPLATSRAPLLLVPGGPGAPHDYMAELADLLAARGRPVIVYDPVGSGSSERPAGVDWSIELYLEELAALVADLGLRAVHVLGSSSGGMVGVLWAARRPPELRSLILSSTPVSVPRYREGILRLIAALPDDVRLQLELFEQRPVTTPEYLRAWDVFRGRHVCRVPIPASFHRAISRLNGEAFRRMKGDMLRYVGTLKDFDATPQLREIAVPTLFTGGRHDSLLLEICVSWQAMVPGARLIVFDESSHMPYVEEPANYADAVATFLDEVEASESPDTQCDAPSGSGAG